MNNVLAKLTQDAFKLAMQLLQEPADAHDVLQDAAAIAIAHKNAPNHQSNDFKPWFFRVVRNKAIDRLRQKKRHNHVEIDDEVEFDDTSSNPELDLATQQLQQQVRLSLNRLPIKQREILLLKDFHGFSYKDIAAILNIPKGSVMSKLHRARLALKARLQAEQENDYE